MKFGSQINGDEIKEVIREIGKPVTFWIAIVG